MSEKTQKLFGGKTVSEKYTYYEVGECDTWHIWDNEVRVLKDDSFLLYVIQLKRPNLFADF